MSLLNIRGALRRCLASGLALVLLIAPLAVIVGAPSAAADPRPFSQVLSGIYRGDMVMATNSNLLSAGRPGSQRPAQIDSSTDDLCPWAPNGASGQPSPAYGAQVKRACNNSSSAVLDIPANAKIVQARLYVMNTLREERPATEVRMSGPGESAYRLMGTNTTGARKFPSPQLAVTTLDRGGAITRRTSCVSPSGM